jgi:circadian clock protein KaiC
MDSQRISTGIGALDGLLHGGFTRGGTYLFSGAPGTGKTIACLQFVLAALKQEEKAVYVTVDERPAEILDSAASLAWNLQSYIQEKKLVILDASPYFGGRAGGSSEKGIDPAKIVADLGNYVKRLGATLLIIDPVTPLILPPDAASPSQDQARSLLQLVQTQINTTNILTAHLCAGAPHGGASGIEEYLAAGVLVFNVREIHDRLERTLTIKKMRGVAVQPKSYRFTLEQEKGIVFDEPAGKTVSAATAPPMFEFFVLEKKTT